MSRFSIHINSPVLTRKLHTFIMCYTYYYMSSCKFSCIYDFPSTFRLFKIIISLSLHLVSFSSFKEIIQIRNIFTTLLKLTLLHGCFSCFLKLYKCYQIAQGTTYKASELSTNTLSSFH